MLSNLSLLLKPLLPRPLDQSHRRNMLSFCTIFQTLFSQRLVSPLPVMYKPNFVYFMTLLYDSLITPEHTITVTSRDPHYITPHIKAKLRKKNRLMRAGQTEKASALALRIGKDIVNRNQSRLSRINSKTSTKDLWAAVRQFTGVDRALVSSTMYLLTLSINITRVFLLTLIISLHSVNTRRPWNVFTNSLLLNGKCSRFWTATATGLDQLPAWFLRIGAPAFYTPITRLFNMSIES